MTNQEIFDKVVNHLLQQKRKAQITSRENMHIIETSSVFDEPRIRITLSMSEFDMLKKALAANDKIIIGKLLMCGYDEHEAEDINRFMDLFYNKIVGEIGQQC